MNSLLKDNWIKALRSGKYSQGYGRLYNPSTNCHCVLGVLCRVADIPIEPGGYSTSVEGKTGLQLIRDLLTTNTEDLVQNLYNKNDRGHSFHQLADYIEKTVLADES